MADESYQPTTRPVPLWLPISGVVILLIGWFLGPVITNSFSEEQLTRNAILSGFQFLLVFIAIILFYATFIWWLAVKLNGRIPAHIYRIIEGVFIGGIVLGVLGMLQPWIFPLYRYGFYLLLASTIGFIAFSHIAPGPETGTAVSSYRAEADAGGP